MLFDEDIQLVKSQVSMMDIANYYGMKVSRQGYTLCPFHNDRHPSMQIFPGYTEKEGFYCRSCGAGGTIFNFVMNYENLTFEESVRKIANMFSIPVSEEGEKPTLEERKNYRIRMVIFEADRKIQKENCMSMIELSEKIRLYENLFRNARPYGSLFCYLANKLPMLQRQWEWRFEFLCQSK